MSISSEITRLENAKASIAAAIAEKGVTVPDGTLLDGMAALVESIEAGGGGEVLNFFGGSKYYITEVTPASNTSSITITPDDTTILNSPKFLLVTQDKPTARNVVQTRAIARAPSSSYYLSAAIVFSIGQVSASCFAYVDPYSGSSSNGYVSTDVNGGSAFNGSHGVNISGGGITMSSNRSERVFEGGQAYKVLLIG